MWWTRQKPKVVVDHDKERAISLLKEYEEFRYNFDDEKTYKIRKRRWEYQVAMFLDVLKLKEMWRLSNE